MLNYPISKPEGQSESYQRRFLNSSSSTPKACPLSKRQDLLTNHILFKSYQNELVQELRKVKARQIRKGINGSVSVKQT
jgi:hypothetical protein